MTNLYSDAEMEGNRDYGITMGEYSPSHHILWLSVRVKWMKWEELEPPGDGAVSYYSMVKDINFMLEYIIVSPFIVSFLSRNVPRNWIKQGLFFTPVYLVVSIGLKR